MKTPHTVNIQGANLHPCTTERSPLRRSRWYTTTWTFFASTFAGLGGRVCSPGAASGLAAGVDTRDVDVASCGG
eukprot:scaffold116703_cov63-Phaeocystis_antarctica.AAC.2